MPITNPTNSHDTGSTGRPDPAPAAFLDVRDLRIHFPSGDGVVKAVDGLSFQLQKGRSLGIVGESGSGKSVTSLGILGLHRRARVSGQIWLDNHELVTAPRNHVRRLRGQTMAMIFQNPLSAMHPAYTVGHQIGEAYRVHNHVSRRAAHRRAVQLLDLVGIPDATRRVDSYPHEFSGGMRQRAVIAMALSCDPQLLVADEPTTALDVTVQAQILQLLRDIQRQFGTSIIFITHDLGVVAEITHDVLVMYAGRAAEYASTADIFAAPEHPYTWGLLTSVTRLDRDPQQRLTAIAGAPPSLVNVPAGCPFHPRCPYAPRTGGRSDTDIPELEPTSATHGVACHLPRDTRQAIWHQELEPTL